MIILMKHLFKNIVENKFRSVAIIFIVILSTMVSVIALSLNDIVTATYENVYNASIGEANITIEKEEPFPVDGLNLSGVEIEKQENLYDISGKFYVDNLVIRVAIRGIDVKQYLDMGSLAIIDYSDNFSLNNEECIISAKSAEKYGLKVGSRFAVYINDEKYMFTVKALGENNRTFYEEQGNIQVLIPLSVCNAIEGNSGKCTKIRLKTTTSSAGALSTLSAQNPDYVIYEDEEFENLHFQMQSVSGAMLIIMCIVILIGGYIISSLVKIIMTDRMPVVGTFRSIGTDQNKVVFIILFEFLLYGIIGMTIGMLCGLCALPKVADLFNQYKEYGVKTVVEYNVVYILAAAVIGLLLAPIMALTKVIRTSKTDIKEIVLQTDIVKEVKANRGVIEGLITLILCFATYFLNRSDSFIIGLLTNALLIVGSTFVVQVMITCISKILKKNIKKGGSCLVGISGIQSNRYVRNNSSMLVTICLIFIMLITIIDGIRNTAQNDLESYGFDIISIINDEDISKEDMEKFDGVTGAFESYETMAFGDYANGYCRVYGIEKFDYLKQYMEALSYSGLGEELDEKLASVENGIVIDQYWARVRNIDVGDKIKLYYDDTKKKVAGEFTVVDMWDCSRGTTDRVFVGINLNHYKRIFENNPERILIKTKGDAEEIAMQISQHYIDKNISVQTTMDFLQEQINTVNTILSILIVSIIMSSAVIVIGISSNMIVAFIRRKKEFATLYSVCMDMKQIKYMIFWESIASYISISLTVLLVYLPLVACIPKLTSGLGLIINYNAKLSTIVGVLFVTFAIILLTTIEPIRRLGRMNIVEELKYE